MRYFGLTGFPLSHSFSEKYFNDKFSGERITDAIYKNYPLEKASGVRELFLKYSSLSGLNVTIPHKQSVIPFLDEIDSVAAAIGAVNVIKPYRTGSSLILKGFNTDAAGFLESLPPFLAERGGDALVLGSGGAALAVIHVLTKLNFRISVVNRSVRRGTLSFDDVTNELLANATIIVNATPLGMYPEITGKPLLQYEGLSASTLLYDLVYNPPVTQFMAEGIKRGCKVINGYKMLEIQAERAWNIWNDPLA
jgi:shikimate dehydrogenase